MNHEVIKLNQKPKQQSDLTVSFSQLFKRFSILPGVGELDLLAMMTVLELTFMSVFFLLLKNDKEFQ